MVETEDSIGEATDEICGNWIKHRGKEKQKSKRYGLNA